MSTITRGRRMEIGLLFFDNHPTRTLQEKVTNAAWAHLRKFDTVPTTCYIHPKHGDDTTEVQIEGLGTIQILQDQHTLRNHFWVGINSG